jgi:hypothetical protein
MSRFDPDDLDWAMGELMHLFAKASRLGQFPHYLDASLFYEAWGVLNAQPFHVRDRCRQILLDRFNPFEFGGFADRRRRYANVLAH